jgi:hypothetical protein
MPYAPEGAMSQEKKQEKAVPDLKEKELDADKAQQVKGGRGRKAGEGQKD